MPRISFNISLQPKQQRLYELASTSSVTWVGYGGSRGGGKDLGQDVLVPVSLDCDKTGFKRHGDIEEGDIVFSASGLPTKVIATTIPRLQIDAYEVCFNTGERIVAGVSHLWVTMDHSERVQATHSSEEWRATRRARRPSRANPNSKVPWLRDILSEINKKRSFTYLAAPTGKIRTTKQIAATISVQDGRELNHSVAVAAPIQLQDALLPVDPYLLGKLWVLKNKHIPSLYKRASFEQRLALLQGLLDTAGHCDQRGQIEFTTTDSDIAKDTLELINSLGIKASLSKGDATIKGVYISKKYRLKFVSPYPCFRLQRKLVRQKLSGFRPTVQRRYIVAVNPIPPCKTKCITVDDPSGTYLVGSTFIPTHNSNAARAIMLKRRLENSNTKGAIFRRTYDLVRENHIDPYLKEYPILREWYHKGDKEIRIPNGSTIAFRYAETSADVDNHIGKEYMDIIVDQAEAFSEREITTFKSCCRWPGVPESSCKFILTFNPGNVGHRFLKRIFYDRKYNQGERAGDYAFIQAYGWDNVEWCRSSLMEGGCTPECGGEGCGTCPSCEFYSWDDNKRFDYYIHHSQFGREQNALPPAMRVGWLLGNMDQFAGQYYDIFSQERHVMRCQPDDWNTRWLGIDWGFAHESVCYWCSQVKMNLTAFYREFAGTGRSPKALAQEIVDRTPQEERGKIRHIFLSHDAFAKRDERDTIEQQMAGVFRANGMPWPERGTKDVIGRATLLYDLMGPVDPTTGVAKTPEVVIDPSCKRLIETIPMICRDQDDPERTVKFDGDDPFDAAAYALTYRMGKSKRPDELDFQDEASRIQDPVAKWFFIQKHRKETPRPIVEPRIIMPWEV